MPKHSPAVAERIDAVSELAVAALQYAEVGFRVLPLRPGRKDPLTPHGLKDASGDLAQVSAWWARWPNANIGLSTDGLVVFDFDPAKGGIQELDRLEAEHGRFRGRRHLTGSHDGVRGVHLIFRQDGVPVRNAVNVLPGVDVRGDGGYVVAPPSLHPSGVRYEVVEW